VNFFQRNLAPLSLFPVCLGAIGLSFHYDYYAGLAFLPLFAENLAALRDTGFNTVE
jgi:hypothetical protein